MNTEKIRVAYVEDHTFYRNKLVEKFQSAGDIQVVISAGKGSGLIQGLEQDSSPQICLVDIGLPDMSGFKVVSAIRKRWPDKKIIIFSAHSFPGYLIRMVEAEVNGYFKKDCDIVELITAIRSLRERDRVYSDVLSFRTWKDILRQAYPFPLLTPFEKRLLPLLSTGMSCMQISGQLNTSYKSVEYSKQALFNKFNSKCIQSLVAKAYQWGYISVDADIDLD